MVEEDPRLHSLSYRRNSPEMAGERDASYESWTERPVTARPGGQAPGLEHSVAVLVFRSMRSLLSLGAVAGLVAGLAACPGGTGSGPVKNLPTPPLPTAEPRLELPPVPSKIDVVTSAPTDGNAPDKRSPILDIMKAENDRQMAALRQQKDPAHYLAYQLVEQRIVNLEADGGALIADSDDTARNLDVEVRVGSPELDNTRALADDANNLNAPLTRRGIVPFGDDKQALSNSLWLETDRRYREAVNALGYVRQDQATLKKRHRRAGLLGGGAGGLRRARRRSSSSTRTKWIERLQALLREGAVKGQATRGTCQRRVPAQHRVLRQQRGHAAPAVVDQRAARRSPSASRPTTA